MKEFFTSVLVLFANLNLQNKLITSSESFRNNQARKDRCQYDHRTKHNRMLAGALAEENTVTWCGGVGGYCDRCGKCAGYISDNVASGEGGLQELRMCVFHHQPGGEGEDVGLNWVWVEELNHSLINSLQSHETWILLITNKTHNN